MVSISNHWLTDTHQLYDIVGLDDSPKVNSQLTPKHVSGPPSGFSFPCSRWSSACRSHFYRDGWLPGALTGMTNSLLACILVALISKRHALSTASTSQGYQHLSCHWMFTLILHRGLPWALPSVCVRICVRLVHTTPLGHNTAWLHWALWSDNVASVFPHHSQTQRCQGTSHERLNKDKWPFGPEPPWCEQELQSN